VKLRQVASEEEWTAYHAIRKAVLWDARGDDAYDYEHPDERLPDHHAMLLVVDEHPVGTVRVDLDPPEAWLRRVAVVADLQRRGHGRRMLELATAFARDRGCRLIRSNVAPDAVGFYEQLSFERDVGDVVGGSVSMTRRL
jgi:GNAT superfamily N-acetyltransferase